MPVCYFNVSLGLSTAAYLARRTVVLTGKFFKNLFEQASLVTVGRTDLRKSYPRETFLPTSMTNT